MDRFLEQIFLLAWAGIFYGILFLFHKLVPRGFIIAQILFILAWRLLPYYDINYLGYLPYDNIPIFWFTASIIFLFLLFNQKVKL